MRSRTGAAIRRAGKACICGLRITVADVLEWLAEGQAPAQIIEDFSELEDADIRACLDWAAG